MQVGTPGPLLFDPAVWAARGITCGLLGWVSAGMMLASDNRLWQGAPAWTQTLTCRWLRSRCVIVVINAAAELLLLSLFCTGATPAGVSIAAAEAKRLRDALSRVGVMGSEVPKAAFSTKNLEQDLGRLLQVQFSGYKFVQRLSVGQGGRHVCGCDCHAQHGARLPVLCSTAATSKYQTCNVLWLELCGAEWFCGAAP